MPAPSIHLVLDDSYGKLFSGVWRAYSLGGACLIALGVTSLLLPAFLDSKVLVYAGGLLAAAGAQILVSTIAARHLPGVGASLILGLISLSAGICLTQDIAWVSGNLVQFFAAYFLLAGSVAIFLAQSHRHQLSGNWEWLMVCAFLSWNLALVSLSTLPASFSWIFSIFLGLHITVYGSALLAVALTSEEYRAVDTDACAGLKNGRILTRRFTC